MTVAGLLAILVLAVVGVYVISARESEMLLQEWPGIRPDATRSEPMDEGAPVGAEEPQGPDLRKAA